MEETINKQNDIEREYTLKDTPEITELIKTGDALEASLKEKLQELEVLGNKVQEMKLTLIPADEKKKHYALRKEKEEMERERNKIFLKVQKIKDRIIPMIQKMAIPLLEEFEDTETVTIEKGKISIKIFSHLEDWKAKFWENRKKATAPASESKTLGAKK